MNLAHKIDGNDLLEENPVGKMQLVFVYGTLKKGESADGFLKDCEYQGMTSIPGVMVHLGRFPGLVDHEVCRVTGEVYKTPWDVMKRLDNYESAPAFYHRRQVKTPWGNAWTYYKNDMPTLNDATVCVDRGIWRGGSADRISYGNLLDYFTNKRWNEPQFRVGPQPIIPAEIIKTHEEQARDSAKVVNLLEHKQQKAKEEEKPKIEESTKVDEKPVKVEVKVGPGLEEL